MAFAIARNTAYRTQARGVACAALLARFAVVPSAAFGQAVNFAGRHITIVSGSPAGGAYDAYARLVGRHLGSLLPGKPEIVVEDMPGAGSLIAANWLMNSAPRDGTTMAILPNATLFEPLFSNSNAHFDARKINWLVSLDDFTPVAAVWAETPFMTARDLLVHDVLDGASGAASVNSMWPKLLNSLVHTNFKVINGYPGSAEIAMALERGEVQSMVEDWDGIKAIKADWLRDKKIRILLQATLTRHSELPEVPTALELVDAEDHDVLALLIARETYGRPFLAPPGVSASIVAALREGFTEMVDDPAFERDARQSNLTIHVATGDEMTATLGTLFASPRSVIDRATTELRRFAPQ